MAAHQDGIEQVPARELPQVVDVLCEAFHDYPVMRFVLGSSNDYDDRLRQLVHFFASARVHRNELMLAVRDESGWRGVALVSYPGRSTEPGSLALLRESTWRALGDDARERYEAFGTACGPLFREDIHLHVNMIGTRTAARGQGLARRLLDAVHELSEDDAESSGVSLSTEDPQNVPLYEHLGYRVTGTADVTPKLKTWALFRPTSPRS